MPRFDEAYYRRYYLDEHSRAVSPEEARHRAEFLCAYLTHLDVAVRRVIDIGCGLGYFRDAFARHYPRAKYVGVELSPWLCEQFGWRRGSVVDVKTRTPFDVVICYDVVQYLDHVDCELALANLARLCRGVLFFGVLTRRDWQENCDVTRTDGDVYLRSGRWYRRRLREHFRNAGGGLYVRRDLPVTLWEIESLD